MTREPLARAADRVSTAADLATAADDETRLADLAAQLEGLADGERDPDHGRLARLENALRDVDDGEDVTEELDAALADVRTFRETLEGV